MQKSLNKSKSKLNKKIEIKPIEQSNKRFHTLENTFVDTFPKNANEFRHIIEDIKCCKADVEFMLELRRHKKINNIPQITGAEPSFYREDLTKYKTKTTLKLQHIKIIPKQIH